MADEPDFNKVSNSYNLIMVRLYEDKQRGVLTPEHADKMLEQAMELLRSVTVDPRSPATEAMLAETSAKIWGVLFND